MIIPLLNDKDGDVKSSHRAYVCYTVFQKTCDCVFNNNLNKEQSSVVIFGILRC